MNEVSGCFWVLVNFEKCVCNLLLVIIYNLVAPPKLETTVYNIISIIVAKNGTNKN